MSLWDNIKAQLKGYVFPRISRGSTPWYEGKSYPGGDAVNMREGGANPSLMVMDSDGNARTPLGGNGYIRGTLIAPSATGVEAGITNAARRSVGSAGVITKIFFAVETVGANPATLYILTADAAPSVVNTAFIGSALAASTSEYYYGGIEVVGEVFLTVGAGAGTLSVGYTRWSETSMGA